jgi:putative transferase (TIGR04331 family)
MRLIKTAIYNKQELREDDLYLGAWCSYENDEKCNLKPKTLHYHWDDRDKYYHDYLYLDSLYEEKLGAYVEIMNEIHNFDKDIEYWRVIIGPWLRSFIDVLYDRFKTIEIALDLNVISEIEVYQYNLDDWVAKDFSEYHSFILSDPWNEIVYSEVIKYFNFPFTVNDKFTIKQIKHKGKEKINVKSLVRNFFFRMQGFIPSSMQKIVLVEVYAPIINIIKLQIKLKQLACYGVTFDTENIALNNKKRVKLGSLSPGTGFENFLDEMIKKFIPRVYIEEFLSTRDKSLKYYPKNPSIIYTSTAYQRNESFKFWVAEKLQNYNVKYFIGQHGGNMGLSQWSQGEEHQKKTAHCFLSWGWSDSIYKNVVRLPSLKMSGISIKHKNQGDILYMTTSLPRYFYSHMAIPVAGQNLNYIDSQISFLNNCIPDVLKRLRIRLDSNFDESLDKKLINEGFSDNIDRSCLSFIKQVNNCRICVCTHNGTSFLEMLAANFPVIIFWNPEYNEIRPMSKLCIKSLVDAEILHYTPESASLLLNKIFNNVEDWWASESLQKTRREFVEKYAYASDDFTNSWQDFLNGDNGEFTKK